MSRQPHFRTSTRDVLAALVLATMLPALAVPDPALASDMKWINPAGGYSYDAASWSLGGNPVVPGPQDQALLELVATYNLNWSWPVDSLAWFNSHAGRYRFNIPGRLGIRFGAYFQCDSVTFLTGTFRAGNVNIAYQGSATRALLTGSTTVVQTTDSTSFSTWANSGYQAMIQIQGAARFRSNGHLRMAPDVGGRCSTTVIGGSGVPSIPSQLTTTSSLAYATRGDVYAADYGTCVFRMMNGGRSDIAGDLYMASSSGGNSEVHLYNSATGIGSPRLVVLGRTFIGSNDFNFPPNTAGTATLLLERGSASLNGTCFVGGRGTGSLTVRNGTGLTSGGVWVGPDPGNLASRFAVRGNFTVATITGSLAVAGSDTAASGNTNSMITLDSLATLNYNGTSQLHVWGPSGQLWILNGAQLLSTADANIGGYLGMVSGTLQAPLIYVPPSGTIAGSGTIQGDVVNEGSLLPSPAELKFAGHLTQLSGPGPTGGILRIMGTGSLSARRTFNASALYLDGAMDFGPVPARLNVGGSLIMASTASTRVRLGSRASGLWDTLAVAGTAAFDGTLDLRTLTAFPPAVGDTLTIATMGSSPHQFASVTLDGAPAGLWATVIYGPNSVKVAIKKAVTGVGQGEARALKFSGAGTPRHPGFSIELPGAAHVRLTTHDVTGREVTVLADAELGPGRHEFTLSRGSHASGVCFGRAVISAAGGRTTVLTARVLIIR